MNEIQHEEGPVRGWISLDELRELALLDKATGTGEPISYVEVWAERGALEGDQVPAIVIPLSPDGSLPPDMVERCAQEWTGVFVPYEKLPAAFVKRIRGILDAGLLVAPTDGGAP